MSVELIVYACPVGDLAASLQTYFQLAKANFSANPAHNYMPHITLTGFFEAEAKDVAKLTGWLEAALAAQQPKPDPVLKITQLILKPEFHGLDIRSPYLKIVTADFANRAHELIPLRLKDWLHLSLAYDFPESENTGLHQLAKHTVDIYSSVQWELCLYERHHQGWTQHLSLPL
ncbi:MAG: hypothetical protein AAF267_14045 [Deinococcota bacterium]